MQTSAARISANRANSVKSTGPKTIEGKQRSRRNGLKHGLTGEGIVLLEEDSTEVERRDEELQRELDPQTAMGKILVRQLASLSVRTERSSRQESAAVASRVRHAAEEFDEARIERAELLYGTIGNDPKDCLRKLRKLPEGVDRLIQAHGELRDELTSKPFPVWNLSYLGKLGNLLGLRLDDVKKSRLGMLSRAAWGNFQDIDDPEVQDIETVECQAWARARLIERIDTELAELVVHRETLDLESIELDRAGAADVALFDPSREATLARRYESESRRGFFLALKELRKVESESANRPVAPPKMSPEPDALASSWEGAPPPRAAYPTRRETSPTNLRTTSTTAIEDARRPDGGLITIGRAPIGVG